ncbi:MAG: acyl-CoA dehydrogenase family protein [Ruegeria sp.]
MTVSGSSISAANIDAIKDFAASLPKVTSENFGTVWKAVADFGLLGLITPQEFGGAATTAHDFVQHMSAFGHGCSDNGLALGINAHIWTIQHLLIRFGSPEQKDVYLPGMLAGETIGAFALTEPSSGSDALSVSTTAIETDNGYVLNGLKSFIGMAPVCDLAVVFANTAPDKGRWGLSAFLVNADDAGFQKVEAQPKMGLTSVPMGQLLLKDCFVPAARRIGPEGVGSAIIQTVLNWERCFILTSQVGAMTRQLEECAAFTTNRQSFGQNIAEYQSVSNRLADMRVRLETCRLMLNHAAELYDTNQPLTQFAAMVNLHISEAFLSSSMDTMRTFGGRGYLQGSEASLDLNDAMGGVIYSGTSDIQRQIIAKMEIGQLPLVKNGERKSS